MLFAMAINNKRFMYWKYKSGFHHNLLEVVSQAMDCYCNRIIR